MAFNVGPEGASSTRRSSKPSPKAGPAQGTWHVGPGGASSTSQIDPNSWRGFGQRMGMHSPGAAANTIWEAAVNPSKHLVPSSLATAMGKSRMTTALARTAAEAVGFDYDVVGRGFGKNWGFLGAGHFQNAHQMAAASGTMATRAVGGKLLTGAFGLGAGIWSIVDTASMVSEGYRTGGVAGAAGGFGQAMAWQYVGRSILGPALIGAGGAILGAGKGGFVAGLAFGGGGGVLGIGAGLVGGAGMAIGAALINPVTIAIAAGAYGYYKAAEFIQHTDRAIARTKQIGSLELGSPIQDQFGTISTLRQRSLQAIQNTHVNGRMAFGNEAALLHSTF